MLADDRVPWEIAVKRGCVVWLCVVGVLAVIGWSGVGSYNGLVAADEKVAAAGAEVGSQYQRRFELVPQLVATVKGAAEFEQQTLTEVVEARASVGRLQLPSSLPSDPEGQAAFFAAQDRLGSSLARLLVVAENYPQLQASAAFRDLQAQIEGTENRIGVARRDYIDAVQAYNVRCRRFPGSLVAGFTGFEVKAQPQVGEAQQAVPVIDFGGGR